jgi:amino acid adenylation domain-containing protein
MPTPFEISAIAEPDSTELNRGVEESLPLSFAQERLWFFSQLESQSALYNVPSAIRLKGPLDIEALQKSFEAIVQRHESLRTNFVSESGNPIQVVREESSISLPIIDLSAASPEQRETQAREWMQHESTRPFDLANDNLLRVSLLRLDPRDHILFLNMHHIVSDEWSLRVLFRELSLLYRTFGRGEKLQLPQLPVQYADFALWQRECLSGEVLDREILYWKKRLGNDFAPLELPADHPRPRVQTYHGATLSASLSKELLGRVNELGQHENSTLFMTLLAAFKTLMHRWTGQEQITVGSPISGRNKIETENLIGFFVNTLALRTNVSGEMTFRELLADVRDVTLGAYAHQDLPFEKLVAELQPQRNAGNLSFLPVMFALQNSAENDLAFPRIETKILDIENETAKFDLTFVVRETSAGLKLIAEYNTDLFEKETVQRALNQYGHLLESIAANPAQKISKLNLLDESERQQLLVDWNKTETNYPREKTIAGLFEEQARKTPDAVALVFGNRQMTYRELDERSNQLANYLRGLGVGPDVLVAICAERSIELLVGFLGILKAGGAYVPLDLAYPAERISFMMEDARCPVLLTQEKLASRFPAFKNRLLCLDSDWEKISREKKTAPVTTTTAENLAYVIYTSGSTGKPKGVAVPNRAVVRLVFNTNYIQLGSSEKIAQASNSSFDAATFEIWGALLHGAQLIGFDKDIILSPSDFAREIERHQITTLFLTTALFNQIAENVPETFRSVKNVLFGGEAVDPKWVREILKRGAPKRLLHVYGPTESTTFASFFEVREVPPNATTIPIGRPISNTQFFVLDGALQPVPVGVPGELHIGGDGLARGYLNAPELNAQKFISNPFKSGERLYKTGDKVRWLVDGNIEFIGRIDHQVKIRGFRIELPEIETLLKQHPAVNDALVLVREERNEKQLVGYVIASTQAPPTATELRQFLKQKLPDYMVPAHLLMLEQFPLNPNGKVDRRALPAPEISGCVEESRSAPLTNLEKKLKRIWEDVMGRKPIGMRENFFDIGGHSLLAVRVFARIEKVLGKKLPLALLFQSPTIEQLARSISDGFSTEADSCLIEIQPNGSRLPVFWLHTLGGGGGGGVLRYEKLARLLGPDQPSYGLVAPPEPFTTIETMAAHYIEQMHIVQSTGPYHLAGYCFGGVVAYEIAQQLRAAGEEVGLLAVLDSSPPNVANVRTLPTNALNLFATLPQRVGRLFQQEPAQIFATLKRKSKKMERILLALLHHDSASAKQIQLEDVIDMEHYPQGYEHFAKVHWEALLNYFPKTYGGKVVLFESTKSPGTLAVETIWRSLAQGGLDVKKLPCAHETMLDEPHVRQLANELNACLQRYSPSELR